MHHQLSMLLKYNMLARSSSNINFLKNNILSRIIIKLIIITSWIYIFLFLQLYDINDLNQYIITNFKSNLY